MESITPRGWKRGPGKDVGVQRHRTLSKIQSLGGTTNIDRHLTNTDRQNSYQIRFEQSVIRPRTSQNSVFDIANE